MQRISCNIEKRGGGREAEERRVSCIIGLLQFSTESLAEHLYLASLVEQQNLPQGMDII